MVERMNGWISLGFTDKPSCWFYSHSCFVFKQQFSLLISQKSYLHTEVQAGVLMGFFFIYFYFFIFFSSYRCYSLITFPVPHWVHCVFCVSSVVHCVVWNTNNISSCLNLLLVARLSRSHYTTCLTQTAPLRCFISSTCLIWFK